MKNRAENAINTDRNLFAFFLCDNVLLSLDLTLRRLLRSDPRKESLADLSSLLPFVDSCNAVDLL